MLRKYSYVKFQHNVRKYVLKKNVSLKPYSTMNNTNKIMLMKKNEYII